MEKKNVEAGTAKKRRQPACDPLEAQGMPQIVTCMPPKPVRKRAGRKAGAAAETYTISPTLLKKLAKLAAGSGRDLADLVNEAVEGYLKSQREK